MSVILKAPEDEERVLHGRALALALALAGDCELATLWYVQERPHPACHDPAWVHRLLPGLELVWIAIAQDERAAPALAWADALAAGLRLPVINTGRAIAAMTRQRVSTLLAPIAGALVPEVSLVPMARLEAGEMPYPWPAILRPLHSHAGMALSAEKWAVEARFLADLEGSHGPRAMAALRAIGCAVP